jgi:hypothetical protein
MLQYLNENKYDGLFNDECSCKKDDLFPCGECFENCKPGYLCNGDDEYDYYIKAEKESVDSVVEKY